MQHDHISILLVVRVNSYESSLFSGVGGGACELIAPSLNRAKLRMGIPV